MENEKDLLETEIEETVVEETEEVVENEETDTEATEEIFDTVEDEVIDVQEPAKKALPGHIISIISVAATLAVCAVACAGLYFIGNFRVCDKYVKESYNYYNTNPDGYQATIEQLAIINGKTLDEFKTEYKLPADMPGNTSVSNAQGYIPLSAILEMNKIDLETYKMYYGVSDDTITEESLTGEIEKKQLEEQLAQAAEMNATEETATTETEDSATAEEAPADDVAVEEVPAEEAPVEEAPAEEAPVEEAPAE